MQLRDILYVLAAAEEGSFSKAALRVHVSQPALSQMIQRLENELGVKLFIRKSNQVVLTPAGKVFYKDGKTILSLSDQLLQKMQDFNSQKYRELTIAISPLYQKSYLLRIMADFQKRHPDVKIRIVDSFSNDSEDLLFYGKVDLAFVMLPYTRQSIQYEPVLKEQIFLAIPRTFAINRRLPDPEKNSCTLKDLKLLKDQPFIMYREGRRMWKSSMALCRAAGFAPKIAYEANICESLNIMIEGGMGIGFVPSAIRLVSAPYDKVIYYPIDSPLAARTLTIGFIQDNLSLAAKEFIRIALNLEQ